MDFAIFGAGIIDVLSAFGGRIGVVDIGGLLKAAGSMSGILFSRAYAAGEARLAIMSRSHQ